MGNKAIQFDEAAGVEEEVEPFPGGELALPVLLSQSFRATALLGLGLSVVQLIEEFARGGQGP